MTAPSSPPYIPETGQHLLVPGETLLQTWRPNLRIFLRKLIWVGFLTALFLGSGLWFIDASPLHILLIWIASTPVAMAFYIFIFGDYEEWFRRRGERWLLTDRRLIFFGPGQDLEPLSIPLVDIVDIRPWMWWTLRLSLDNDQKLTLDYLPNRAEIRASILTARAKAIEETDD